MAPEFVVKGDLGEPGSPEIAFTDKEGRAFTLPRTRRLEKRFGNNTKGYFFARFEADETLVILTMAPYQAW